MLPSHKPAPTRDKYLRGSVLQALCKQTVAHMLALPKLLSTTASRVIQTTIACTSALSPLLCYLPSLSLHQFQPARGGRTTSRPSRSFRCSFYRPHQKQSYHTQVQQADKPKSRNPDDALALLTNLTDKFCQTPRSPLFIIRSLFSSPALFWLALQQPSNSSFSLRFPLSCGVKRL